MNTNGVRYALEPKVFRSMGEAQELTYTLAEDLAALNLGAANVRSELIEIFS